MAAGCKLYIINGQLHWKQVKWFHSLNYFGDKTVRIVHDPMHPLKFVHKKKSFHVQFELWSKDNSFSLSPWEHQTVHYYSMD